MWRFSRPTELENPSEGPEASRKEGQHRGRLAVRSPFARFCLSVGFPQKISIQTNTMAPVKASDLAAAPFGAVATTVCWARRIVLVLFWTTDAGKG